MSALNRIRRRHTAEHTQAQLYANDICADRCDECRVRMDGSYSVSTEHGSCVKSKMIANLSHLILRRLHSEGEVMVESMKIEFDFFIDDEAKR